MTCQPLLKHEKSVEKITMFRKKYQKCILTLKEITNASGAHSLTSGPRSLGTNWRETCKGPSADWILCSGWKGKTQTIYSNILIIWTLNQQ